MKHKLAKVQSLREHINESFGGNNAAFARSMSVEPQQVTKWHKQGLIVVDGEFYRPAKINPKTNSLPVVK